MSPEPALVMTESFSLPLSERDVWELFSRDPKAVAQCVPGATVDSVADDGSMSGHMDIALGATRVTFAGTVSTEYDPEGREITIIAKGADARGKTRASAATHVKVVGQGDSAPSTNVDVRTRLDVSGALAGFVRSGGAVIAARMVDEFATNLAHLSNVDASTGAAPTRPLGGLRLLGTAFLQALKTGVQNLMRWIRGVRHRDKDRRS